MPIAAESSPPSSEREERVFTVAFSIMDSSQDGEAVAAFLRVRELLHRHGGSFRRMLERYEEAERTNDALGRQNAQLLRENMALRARDSRPIPSATVLGGARRLLSRPSVQGFRHWDIGFMVVIAVWAAFGLLGAASAFTLGAAVLIFAAFTHWFSPLRLVAGVVLAMAAYAAAAPAPAKPLRPASGVAAFNTDGPYIESGAPGGLLPFNVGEQRYAQPSNL
jgi:hypothetical protein